MTLEEISVFTAGIAENSPTNRIQAEWALDPALAGMRMFDAPLLGVAAADDPLFTAYRRPEAVGPQFLTPAEWLPGARSVVSLFLPFTPELRRSNREGEEPSFAWLHGRIEGQRFLVEFCVALAKWLDDRGGETLVPVLSDRFRAVESLEQGLFTSNWSERHAAYAAGLGTFGLSAGLITRRGVAGRLGSVITTLAIAPTPRDYRGLYDYCSRCMACARRCPAQAIDETGKHHPPCKRYLAGTAERYAPRYGCGKCQVGVPCEAAAPGAPSGA